METVAKLARKHKLGRICRVSTWILAIIGAIHIVLQSYTLWHAYSQTVANQSFQEPALYTPQVAIFLDYIPSVLYNSATYLFYCIVLYTASVIFEAIGAQSVKQNMSSQQVKEPEPEKNEMNEFEEEDIVYTSLKREDILLGKQQISNNRHQSGKL